MNKKLLFSILLFTALSLASLNNLFAEETFQLELKPEINYISIPLGSSWKVKEDIFAKIEASAKQSALWDTVNSKYLYCVGDPDFDQFTKFEFARGYWLYLKDLKTTRISLTGITPYNYKLSLKKGWNAIGCPRTQAIPLEEALLPLKLGQDYASVWRYAFKDYPWYQQYSQTKKEFTHLKPGEGYWIYMLRDANWTVNANQSPIINSIIPIDNSTFLAGARINIQINASDPNNDSLEYQFSIGGTIKQPWSSSNTYTWQTSASDTGSVSITCKVRDNKGAITSKTITYRIINPTIQEILQKVVDNYALVNDKKMDVTMTSKFNTEDFGSTIYTRHYFKKPDKQRTDTFTTSERTEASKTEIQITVGPDAYLIDPISHAQSHRNILTDLNLTQAQLNQMDEIYHLQGFLNAHNLSRKDKPEDLAKGLVMIEAIPKIPSNIYSKLGIQIDYFKGLRTKSLTYFKEDSQDKLKQAIEITNSQAMSNGAWVPKAQIKTLYLTEGNLIMTSTFDSTQINTGLPDYLFDPTKQ